MGTTEQTVAGEVLRLTYHDETTAFTVAKLMPHRGGREIAIVGYMPMIQVGQQVRCTGTWQIDPKHGKQFSVQKLSYELPTDPSSIQRLIASGFLKGIGPVFAEKIVRQRAESEHTRTGFFRRFAQTLGLASNG